MTTTPLILIHPRHSLKEDCVCTMPELSNATEQELENIMSEMPPVIYPFADELEKNSGGGLISAILLKGSQIISDDMATQRLLKKRAMEKIVQAVNLGLEKSKGKHLIVSLGALTSPISNQGKDLLTVFADKPVSFTTGNPLTAYFTIKAVELLSAFRGINLQNDGIFILGASGSVGGAVSEHFASKGCRVNLSARNEAKLAEMKKRIVERWNLDEKNIAISTNLDNLNQHRMVVVTAASNTVLIQPHHCAQNAVIYDDTVPRNTSAEIIHKRPDVWVIDGGIVEMPFIDYGKVTMGLPGRRTYACQVEAMLLAKEGIKDNFVGNVTLEQVEFVGKLLEKHEKEFHLAPFTSFGREIDIGV